MYPSTIYSQFNPTENTFIDDTGFFLDVIIGYLNDNVTAIENKLGVDGSAVVTSIDYLVKNPLSINPGHKHTSTSITLTTANVPDTTDKRYVTDSEKTVIDNTSGVNTGNQTLPVKTTGAAINTGTNDTDFVTSKAIAESYISALPTATSTTTFTNKRIEPRVVTAASYTTDTGTSLTVATADVFQVTAQAGALKLNNPGGTPVAGQKLIVRIKDNGTARALTYDTQFRASSDLALPTTTVLSKTLYMGFIYNLTDTKWDLLAVLNNI